MASDLSSECTETIGVLDEKEEGEISLEDVSSSEEGHLNYGYGTKIPHCSNCLSAQHNAAWCTAVNKFYPSKCSNRREVHLILQDAVQEKENRHQIKESGCIGTKHTASTLQEKNDDLVPISSDSDMEIVGLADNSKQIVIRSASKSRMKKKRKKKRNHAATISIDDLVSSSTVDVSMTEFVNTTKHDTTKTNVRSYHRETSPVHRNKSRVIPRSPNRKHRSAVRTRSPFRRSKSPIVRARSPTIRRSKSPIVRARSPTIRRSPKRPKSPKRSPYRSSTKTLPRKTSHPEITSSRNYVDTHKLLKKVRELDSIGTHSLEETLNKNKEHASSLKEKLTNMMKGVSDNNSDVTNSIQGKSTTSVIKKGSNDPEDEEDLALLRQKALDTKQSKSSKQIDQPKVDKKISTNINDDQDEEDLELRMIALRSAVLKKHQNRVQKGIRSGKYKKSGTSRSESPFTQSFLDSIPIPGEELLNFASPPRTPPLTNENNHTEDMDLDTDVEREKEKLPYSPTDKITANIPMDTELLGIQPSDVSFISLIEANGSPNFTTSITSSHDDQKSYQGKIIENHSYLPNIMYYAPPENLLCPTSTNLQYVTVNPTNIFKPNFMKAHNSHANVQQYENTRSIPKDGSNTSQFVDVASSQEMPYSPTDTPMYDPDLSHALPQTCGPLTTSNSSLVSLESHVPNVHQNSEQYGHLLTSQRTSTTKEINNANDDEQLDKAETHSLDPAVGSATTSLMESVSPSSSMITFDDPPEFDTDDVLSIKSTGCIPHVLSNNSNGKEATTEPLYMKGVPDVTKDTNKIPTLINRTLVPAPILKTNKQLQLPLPTKKCAAQQEPTFKSAEMRPVTIDNETSTKINASFKPIKLTSIPQKSHSVLTVSTAFHDCLHEDGANEVSTDKAHILQVETNCSVTLVHDSATIKSSDITCDISSPVEKKKPLLKKGLKRKSIDAVSSIEKSCDASCPNMDNTDTIDKQTYESREAIRTAEEDNITGLKQQMDTKDSTHTSMLEIGNNNISLKMNELEHQSNDAASNNAQEQIKSIGSRRQSLDEDEEALRAILLASLPKRAKTTNTFVKSDAITSVSVGNSVLTIAPIVPTATSVPNQVFVKETASTAVLNTVNITNTTSTDGTTPLSVTNINDYGPENDKNHYSAGEKVNSVAQSTSIVQHPKASNSITSERKRSVPIVRGPQKKLVKRISIPASTKVVNNAKKYQNTMIQKKLNIQKATLYNKQKVAETKTISKVQSYDMKRSVNAKALLDTQRIVINLESDTESDSESERQKNATAALVNSVVVEKHRASINTATDFEKNLDQFLRAVRNKQESVAAARPTSMLQNLKKDMALSPKTDQPNSSNLHTPLAVRHLPASQQEEYRRLKQQILEREKLKLHRTIENNSLVKNKNAEAPSKSTLSSSPSKELHGRLNEVVPRKSQSISAQQLNKENVSKNLEVSIKNTSLSTANVQSCSNKVLGTGKPGSTSPSQGKPISSPPVNPNICVSAEKDANNDGDKAVGSCRQPMSARRKVFETPINVVQMKTKVSPGLKILSTDEVNQKYIQVQVKNDTNERVVTINDKVTLNNKTSINTENVSRGADSSDKSICDYNINQIIQCVEKDVISHHHSRCSINDAVDSDASTIILSRANENIERNESFDSSESTIRLSQCQEDSRISLVSSTEGKDDCHFLLFKNSGSPNSVRTIEENWQAIKKDVKTELNTLISLSRIEQEQRLKDTEQELVMKRYTILDDLAEMSSNLRQWHMERDLQTNLAAEVKKLREQLKVAEERLQVQRNRINSIGPKVVVAHGKIKAGRKECFKLATICSTLGNRVAGKEYKVPEDGAQLLDSRLKEVANHTRQLSRKKVPSIDIPDTHDLSKLGEETATTVCTEISQTEDLMLVDNIDTSILKKNESVIKSCEIEQVVEVEINSDNVYETSVQENMILNNSALSSSEKSISEENDAGQTTLCDTSTVTSDTFNSKDAQDRDNQVASEDNTATLEADSKKRNFTTSEGELQAKRTLFPYESILTHFKVPRNMNPNGVLCPYELMGTCNDGDCQFVHQTESQAK